VWSEVQEQPSDDDGIGDYEDDELAAV